MKICCLVKEVPDAAVQKRIDSSTKRLDRSGEKNLNPFDTHGIEAAMQIREGGVVDVDEIVAVTMGPESGRPCSAQGRRARRRPLRAPDRWRPRGLRRLRDRLRPRQGARVRVARPGPSGPAVGRRRVLHDRRGRRRPPQDALAHAGHQGRRGRGHAHLPASGRVRLRHGRGRPARRHLASATRSTSLATRRSRRSWARRRSSSTPRPPATSASRPTRWARAARRPPVLEINPPPEKAGGEIIEDEDTDETVEKIVAWLDERKLLS